MTTGRINQVTLLSTLKHREYSAYQILEATLRATTRTEHDAYVRPGSWKCVHTIGPQRFKGT